MMTAVGASGTVPTILTFHQNEHEDTRSRRTEGQRPVAADL